MAACAHLRLALYSFMCLDSRMEELLVYDIQFLHGCAQPTIVLLHQDVHGRHVKSHEISLKDKEFVKVSRHIQTTTFTRLLTT